MQPYLWLWLLLAPPALLLFDFITSKPVTVFGLRDQRAPRDAAPPIAATPQGA